MIWADRKRMTAGQLLDWDNEQQRFTGMMEDAQSASTIMGHPIRVWVIETNIAQRHLLQYEHYRRWRRRWPDVVVIAHQTQMNKLDPDYGVTMLSTRYRTGMKRLPHKPSVGYEGKNFLRVMTKELTTYPFSETDDTVMADWMGETNLPRIVASARRQVGMQLVSDARLPGYLKHKQYEIPLAASGIE